MSSADRPGIRLLQPAPHGDAVRDVGEALRPQLREVGEDRFAHQPRVQLRHAVDAMAADHRQVRHAHAPVAFLVDQRHAAAAVDDRADSFALTSSRKSRLI